MTTYSERSAALTELVRLSESLGLYDVDPDDYRCQVDGCGRLCCRRHEAAS